MGRWLAAAQEVGAHGLGLLAAGKQMSTARGELRLRTRDGREACDDHDAVRLVVWDT